MPSEYGVRKTIGHYDLLSSREKNFSIINKGLTTISNRPSSRKYMDHAKEGEVGNELTLRNILPTCNTRPATNTKNKVTKEGSHFIIWKDTVR